ncbi:MAG: hypothetical protein QNK36_09925 [Colwellia sp.]|nr:hypothetical protein [Colwellia sp.]
MPSALKNNACGAKTIPVNRCAKNCHLGSRKNVTAANILYEE